MISTGRTWDVGNLHGCCGSLCFWGFFHRFTAYGISFRNNDDNGFFYSCVLICPRLLLRQANLEFENRDCSLN